MKIGQIRKIRQIPRAMPLHERLQQRPLKKWPHVQGISYQDLIPSTDCSILSEWTSASRVTPSNIWVDILFLPMCITL
jgi:hypothetical protein